MRLRSKTHCLTPRSNPSFTQCSTPNCPIHCLVSHALDAQRSNLGSRAVSSSLSIQPATSHQEIGNQATVPDNRSMPSSYGLVNNAVASHHLSFLTPVLG